jgi:hypothetical protein
VDEFYRLNSRAALIVENFGVVRAQIGEELQRQMAIFQEQFDDLA